MDKLGGGEKVPPETNPEKNVLLGALSEVSSPSINETPMSRKEHKAYMDSLQESMMEKFRMMHVEHLNKPNGSIAQTPQTMRLLLLPW
jgi:hypothetical protein